MNDRLSVLIIDNDRNTRESLRDLLEAAGYEASASNSGCSSQAVLDRTTTPCIVLLNRIATPTTGLDFVRMAEHEEYLLSIGERIIQESRDLKEAPSASRKSQPKSGEYVRVRPSGFEPELEALVAERRTYQALVAQEMRKAPTVGRKVA